MYELEKRYRPQIWDEVVGQPTAVSMLKDFVARKRVPHTLLFCGESGCGKTTAARILRVQIGCADVDFKEINCAEARGIDDMRTIQMQMGLAPMKGRCRVWLLDEIQSLGSIPQQSMLKPLEDTPRHVYFMLCTTNPEKIIPTVRSRCTVIEIKPVGLNDLIGKINAVAAAEEIPLNTEVAAAIAEAAGGSVRRALKTLDGLAGLTDPAAQLATIRAGDYGVQGKTIAQLLCKPGAKWAEVAAAIKALEGDDNQWESVRYG